MTHYTIRYESIEAWEEHGRDVDELIEKDTGRPCISTKSLPPITIVPEGLSDEARDKLKALSGVLVEANDE